MVGAFILLVGGKTERDPVDVDFPIAGFAGMPGLPTIPVVVVAGCALAVSVPRVVVRLRDIGTIGPLFSQEKFGGMGGSDAELVAATCIISR